MKRSPRPRAQTGIWARGAGSASRGINDGALYTATPSPLSGMSTSPNPAARSPSASAAARSGSPWTSRTLPRRRRQRPQASQQLAVVGVARQAVERHHLRLDRERPPQDAHLRPPFHQPPAQRVGRLEADDQDRATWVLDVVLEVMQDAARLAHAARRDDDARSRLVVQGDAFVDFIDVMNPLLAEQVGVLRPADAASAR